MVSSIHIIYSIPKLMLILQDIFTRICLTLHWHNVDLHYQKSCCKLKSFLIDVVIIYWVIVKFCNNFPLIYNFVFICNLYILCNFVFILKYCNTEIMLEVRYIDIVTTILVQATLYWRCEIVYTLFNIPTLSKVKCMWLNFLELEYHIE